MKTAPEAGAEYSDEAVRQLLYEVFPIDKFRDGAYLRWFYRESPLGQAFQITRTEGGRALAHVAGQRQRYHRHGEQLPAMIPLHLAVSEVARGRGLMVDINRACIDTALAEYGDGLLVSVPNALSTPGYVRRLAEAGNEVGCHSLNHTLIYEQNPKMLRAQLTRARNVLQDQSGQAVLGFRAPLWSITTRSLWALDVLAEVGFRYDSSIFRAKNYLYGMDDVPREPYEIRTPSGARITEIPAAADRIHAHRCGRWRILAHLPAHGTALCNAAHSGPRCAVRPLRTPSRVRQDILALSLAAFLAGTVHPQLRLETGS
jgi:Polysaccharide deacetylase